MIAVPLIGKKSQNITMPIFISKSEIKKSQTKNTMECTQKLYWNERDGPFQAVFFCYLPWKNQLGSHISLSYSYSKEVSTQSYFVVIQILP
jgi:hypothetical protein